MEEILRGGLKEKGEMGGRIKDGLRLCFRLARAVCMCCMCVFNVHVLSVNSKLRDVRLYLLVYFHQPAIPHVSEGKSRLTQHPYP